MVLAVWREQVKGIDLAKAGRVQVAGRGFAVQKLDNDLLVGRGWGAEFQRRGLSPEADDDLHIMELYVMLTRIFLSTYCF